MLSNIKCAMAACMMAGAALLSAQNVSAEDDKPVDPKADNTKTNVRDRDAGELTAGSQSQKKDDVDITAKIRKMVVGDNTLSTNAHNVKIITVDGMVTLKGPVKSEAEKAAVEQHAIHIVGDKKITNQIEIAP